MLRVFLFLLNAYLLLSIDPRNSYTLRKNIVMKTTQLEDVELSNSSSRKKKFNSAAEKAGLPPGTLVHIGKKHKSDCKISVTQYSKETLMQRELHSIKELEHLRNDHLITWINVDGLSDVATIESIGEFLNIHPLVLEDILSTHQRPKLEEYDNFLYIVIKDTEISLDKKLNLQYEQISILLLDHYVVTFKEKSDDTFTSIYSHLSSRNCRIRQFDSDYLAYVIIDTIVDKYFVIEDHLDVVLGPLENNIFFDSDENLLHTIQRIKRSLISMRRNIAPVRELLAALQRSDSDLIHEKTVRYFGDVYDHVLRVMDSLDSFRDRMSDMHDIYLSSLSNKMNETIKILTIFTSIFIPMTFIAGVYGMNFDYLPELRWRWGYPAIWVVFISLGIGMLIFFRKKKWI